MKPNLLVLIPLGVAFYSVGPMVTAHTAEVAGRENLGSVMGLANMVSFFGATVGPYAVGLLIDHFGYQKAFLLIPSMYLLAWALIKLEE